MNAYGYIIDIKQVGAKVELISSTHTDQKLAAMQMEERYNDLLFAYDNTASLSRLIYLIIR